MKIRTASILAAVALTGLAVAAYAQGVFDPGPPPPLPEEVEQAADAAADAAAAAEQAQPGEIVYESYEVVQPIPEEEPGPAARTIEPPAGEWVEAEAASEPAVAPARSAKLVRIERVAQSPDKRIRQ